VGGTKKLLLYGSIISLSYLSSPALAFGQDSNANLGEQEKTPNILDKIELSANLRLRYQAFDLEESQPNGDALTLRAFGTAQVNLGHGFNVLGEVEAITALVDEFNDGTDPASGRALIPDPEGVSINRLKIVSETLPKTRVSLGRQRIALNDWRFIGSFPFRQNDQTFDALRVETRAIDFGNDTGVFDAGVFNQVNRPLGPDNPIGTFNGTSWYANYGVTTPIGRVVGFHYDFSLITPEGDESTATTGARLRGRLHSPDFGVIWEGSYAVQTDNRDNPNDFSVDYWLGSLRLEPKEWAFMIRGEELGAENGQSLQTPLASLHRFSGLADQFTITPPDGLRDLSFLVERNFGQVGPFERIKIGAHAHRFEAAGGGITYGNELDLTLSARVGKALISLEHARYEAESFSVDTRSTVISASFAIGN